MRPFASQLFRLFVLLLTVSQLNGSIQGPPPGALVAPDGDAWVLVERFQGATRLQLQRRRARPAYLLAEGLESLCGADLRWLNAQTLGLRLPGERARALRFKDGDWWEGYTLRLQLHEDLVAAPLPSPDGQRRIVAVQHCESERWAYYLRHPGEAALDPAMARDLSDPRFLGELADRQVPLGVRWKAPRIVELSYTGKRPRVVRFRQGDVIILWKDANKKAPSKGRFKTVKPMGS